MKKLFSYFSRAEILLWSISVFLIVLSFCLFDRESYLTLVASLIGVTSLIFNAKGNPIGQGLMILFSLLYGVISYTFSYFGEMLTYLGMTMPMAFFALLSWMKIPYGKNRSEVRVSTLGKSDLLLLALGTAGVTVLFYFILAYFHTTNLLPSTVSVATSFLAVYLTYRRSPCYALAYAANDIVLILLWGLASGKDNRYLSVVVCFVAFLVNDLYGFLSWQRMKKRQSEGPLP